MALAHNGPRAVCVLSANGAISNVTLRQSGTSGGTVTYEVSRFSLQSSSIPFFSDFLLLNPSDLYTFITRGDLRFCLYRDRSICWRTMVKEAGREV